MQIWATCRVPSAAPFATIPTWRHGVTQSRDLRPETGHGEYLSTTTAVLPRSGAANSIRRITAMSTDLKDFDNLIDKYVHPADFAARARGDPGCAQAVLPGTQDKRPASAANLDDRRRRHGNSVRRIRQDR